MFSTSPYLSMREEVPRGAWPTPSRLQCSASGRGAWGVDALLMRKPVASLLPTDCTAPPSAGGVAVRAVAGSVYSKPPTSWAEVCASGPRV